MEKIKEFFKDVNWVSIFIGAILGTTIGQFMLGWSLSRFIFGFIFTIIVAPLIIGTASLISKKIHMKIK